MSVLLLSAAAISISFTGHLLEECAVRDFCSRPAPLATIPPFDARAAQLVYSLPDNTPKESIEELFDYDLDYLFEDEEDVATPFNLTFIDFYSQLWDVYRAVNRSATMEELMDIDPDTFRRLNDSQPAAGMQKNESSVVFLLKVDNMTDPELLDRLGEGRNLTEAEISQKLLHILATNPEIMDEVLFEQEQEEVLKGSDVWEDLTFRKELAVSTNRKSDIVETVVPSPKRVKKRKFKDRVRQEIVIMDGSSGSKKRRRKKGKSNARMDDGDDDVDRNYGKRKRKRRRKKPVKKHDGMMYHMMPALLGVGSLLGFGFSSLYYDGEVNNFSFNPTISYQGDNTTFSTFDQNTMTNVVTQQSTQTSTNTDTTTNTNTFTNAVIPIIFNTDGTVTVGPITGNGRKKRRRKRDNSKGNRKEMLQKRRQDLVVLSKRLRNIVL